MRRRLYFLINWSQKNISKDNIKKTFKLFKIESVSRILVVTLVLLFILFLQTIIYFYDNKFKKHAIIILLLLVINNFLLKVINFSLYWPLKTRVSLKYILYGLVYYISLINLGNFFNFDENKYFINHINNAVIMFLLGVFIKFFIIKNFNYRNKKINSINIMYVLIIYTCYLFFTSIINKNFDLNLYYLDYVMMLIVIKLGYDYCFMKNYDLTVRSINLDYYNVFSSKIYFTNKRNSLMNFKVLEFDLSNFFPSNASECDISILNHYYVKNVIDKNDLKDRCKFYFCIPLLG